MLKENRKPLSLLKYTFPQIWFWWVQTKMMYLNDWLQGPVRLSPRDGEGGVADTEGPRVKAHARGVVNLESWGVPPELPIAVLRAMATTFYPGYRGWLIPLIFDKLLSKGKMHGLPPLPSSHSLIPTEQTHQRSSQGRGEQPPLLPVWGTTLGPAPVCGLQIKPWMTEELSGEEVYLGWNTVSWNTAVCNESP